jgi:hypothetical protein
MAKKRTRKQKMKASQEKLFSPKANSTQTNLSKSAQKTSAKEKILSVNKTLDSEARMEEIIPTYQPKYIKQDLKKTALIVLGILLVLLLITLRYT